MNEYFIQYPVNIINIRQLKSNSHKGMDLGWDDNKNQPIYSISDGEVVYLKHQITGGWVIGIYHKQFNMTSEYGHLKSGSIVVKLHQYVKRGQKIALMGNTGIVSGNHLHLGLKVGRGLTYKKSDIWLDPLDYVVKLSKQKIAKQSKYQDKILKTLKVKGVLSEPLLIHNKKNFLKSSRVKGLGLKNGDEVPNYGIDKSYLCCDIYNKYYTASKYCK